MKKFLATIVLGVCLMFGGSVLAQTVGEAMPSLEKAQVIFSNSYSANGKDFIMCKYAVDGEYKYYVAYVVCDGVMSKQPTGIFDVKSMVLYLDNAPNDGIIDAMVSEAPYPKIIDSIPVCE